MPDEKCQTAFEKWASLQNVGTYHAKGGWDAGWTAALASQRETEDVLIATRSDLAAAYAKGAVGMREVMKLHVETHSYVRQRDLIEAVDALPIPAAPQPRDLGKLWELVKNWRKDGDIGWADELAAILKEMEG